MGRTRIRRHPSTEGSHDPPPIPRPSKPISRNASIRDSANPATATSARWPGSWPPSPTNNSWGGPNSRSATSSTTSAPRPSRPLSTSGKRGLPRVEPELPGLPRRCPLRRLPPQGRRQPAGGDPPRARLLPLQDVPSGPLPRRPRPRAGPPATSPPAPTQAVCMAGVVGSFAVAAEDVLPRLAGLTLSESTVQRTTEAVGRHVEGLLADGPDLRPRAAVGLAQGRRGPDLRLCVDRRHGRAAAGARRRRRRRADGDRGDGLQPGPRGPPAVGQALRPAPPVAGPLPGLVAGASRPGRAAAPAGGAGRHGRGAAVDRALRRRVGVGGLAGDELRPARCGDPRLLPRLGIPRGAGQGGARRRHGGGAGVPCAVVPPTHTVPRNFMRGL